MRIKNTYRLDAWLGHAAAGSLICILIEGRDGFCTKTVLGANSHSHSRHAANMAIRNHYHTL